MSENYDNSEDEYIPKSASTLPMILAALGVGTVVGAIIGFVVSGSSGSDASDDDDSSNISTYQSEDGKDITLPEGACESAFTDEDEPKYREKWYGESLSEMQREALFRGLEAEEQMSLCSLEDNEDMVTAKQLARANKKLREANEELAKAQQELDELRKAQDKNKKSGGQGSGPSASQRIKDLENQVKELQETVEAVQQERDEYKEALDKTVELLNEQIKETAEWKRNTEVAVERAVHYRKMSNNNQFQAFLQNAEKRICNDVSFKGRRQNCWEHLATTMLKLEDQYIGCVKTEQAVPVLQEFSKKEAKPAYTTMLSDVDTDKKKYLKNWGVVFCDPTLPEAMDSELDNIQNKIRQSQ